MAAWKISAARPGAAGGGVERYDSEEDIAAVFDAVAFGWAVRAAERTRGSAAPLPKELIDRLADSQRKGQADLDSEHVSAVNMASEQAADQTGAADIGLLVALFTPGAETWGWLEHHAWMSGVAASRERLRTRMGPRAAAGLGPIPAAIDYKTAFRFGYALSCCIEARESLTVDTPIEAPPDVGATQALPPVEELFERANEVLLSGKATYANSETEHALTLGLARHPQIESLEDHEKNLLVAIAKAGYAFRRAEETAGIAPGAEANVHELLTIAEAQNPSLQRDGLLDPLGERRRGAGVRAGELAVKHT